MSINTLQTVKVVLLNLALAAVLCLTLGIAAELYLRYRFPPVDYRGLNEATSDGRQYAMKANIHVIRQGIRIITNSDGYRDKEFEHMQVMGKFVVAVLGDSYTFGHGVPQDQTFPVLIETEMNQRAKAELLRVWNLGVPGYNTEQEWSVFENFVVPRAPQWVVVGYNINDYEPASPPSPGMYSKMPEGYFSFPVLQGIFKGESLFVKFTKHRIGNIVRIFWPQWSSSSYIGDVVGEYVNNGSGWQKASKLLKKMNEECNDRGIGFSVAVLPAMFDFSHYPFKRVHEVVLAYCRSQGIDCVDVLPAFRSKNVRDMHVSVLDPHPNGSAQKIFGEAIEAHLLNKPVFRNMLAYK